MRRRLVILAVLVELAAPALACPPLESCVVQLRSTTRAPMSSAHSGALEPPAPPAFDLTRVLREATVHRRDPFELEVPWFWQALRAQVYGRMPAYKQRDGFNIVLAPVVVTSTTDTVPGVGVAGNF